MHSGVARRIKRWLEKAVSLAVAFAMAMTGLVGVQLLQVAGAQRASAGTYTPMAYVANYSANTVSVIRLSDNSVQSTIPVGTSPRSIAYSPDGTKVYVANYTAGTVNVISTASNTVTKTITVGTTPRYVTFSPDGGSAYTTNSGSNTLSVIATSSGTVSSTPAQPGSPYAIALAPDQTPTASLGAIASNKVWTPVTFDASASSDATGTIAGYTWNFGDGTAVVTTPTPTTTHMYTLDGSYTASVIVTNTMGTSDTQVFTGQTVSRNGTAAALAVRTVTIATPFSLLSTPSTIGFSGSINSTNQVLSAPLDLDVSNGLAAGWSLSATSTQWTTGGAKPYTMATSATTVTTAPTVACDTSTNCNPAVNSVSYPYVLPAGISAPTATKIFNANASTGIGSQTITPTLRLNVPGNAHAGTYKSTITVTLSSGP
jgi:YVTN family beta-propeller protein